MWLRASGDGERLAMATGEGAVRVLDATNLAVIKEMDGPSQAQGSLVFSQHRDLLGGLARGRAVQLTVWNTSSGARVSSFADPSVEPNGMSFSPDGTTVALTTMTGDILLIAAGRVLRVLSEPLMSSEGIAFSGDGRSLVAASYDGAVFVWETSSWRGRRFTAPRASTAVAVSGDGRRVAVCGSSFNPATAEAELRVISLASGETLAAQKLGVAPVIAVGFTASGQTRAVTARGALVQLWNFD
jgi:WD40 repeat protein